jgi:hypothetical protein
MKPKNPMERTKRPQASVILECPSCYSHRASILNTRPSKARCADCSTIYKVKFDSPQPWEEQAGQPAQRATSRKGKSLADRRAEITSALAPDPAQLGLATALVDKALAAGPAGLRQAQHVAMRFAKQFQEECEDKWRKVTPWLAAKRSDGSDSSARACVRYALVWRPKFLAALSLTRSPTLSARMARITKETAYQHRRQDEEFAAQWQEAEADAEDLLHAQAFRRALEGDCEPIFYMGTIVGYVRKYDSKLQIEMLRAYKPDTFKTAGVNVNVDARSNVMVLTEAQRQRLIEYNRQWLLDPATLTEQRPSS